MHQERDEIHPCSCSALYRYSAEISSGICSQNNMDMLFVILYIYHTPVIRYRHFLRARLAELAKVSIFPELTGDARLEIQPGA